MRRPSLRPTLSRPLIAAFAVLCTAAASAADTGVDRNRYKWHDASGNLHYGDSLPPDAARLGYEVVNPQGIVVKRVERAKTADELAVAKAEQKRLEAERQAAEARARADEQLLSGYPTEADLVRSQQQKLDLLEQQATTARIGLRSQEQTLADLLSQAAEAERSGKPLPDAQVRQLAALRKQVDEQRLAVARRERERDEARAGFENEVARYRELKARIAAQRQP
jgi:hypothetical protein